MLERITCSKSGCQNSCFAKSPFCFTHTPDAGRIQDEYRSHIRKETLIQDLNLAGMSLEGLDVERKVFMNCDFQGTHFANCRFVACHFSFCFCDESIFENLTLSSSKILESVFSLASFTACNFSGSDILQCNFNGARFESSHFHELDLMYSRFVEATFSKTLMEDCNLKSVYLPRKSLPNFKYSNNEDAVLI